MMMSEQYCYQLKEVETILNSYTVKQGDRLIITQWPSKRKKRVCLIYVISDFFDMDMTYSETEVNDILKPIYEDHVMLRRFLIDLQLLTRDDYGKAYQRTSKRILMCHEKNM